MRQLQLFGGMQALPAQVQTPLLQVLLYAPQSTHAVPPVPHVLEPEAWHCPCEQHPDAQENALH